ncbi:MAG: hypothetical protein IKD45_02480 [Clostridia bacterium]|nr:hypothetical protein [Clostridia bacterium]
MKKSSIIGKAIALLLAAMLLSGVIAVIAGASTAEPGSRGQIDVYLIVGQSNAVGFGSDELSYSFSDSRYTEGFNDVLFYGEYQSDYNPDSFVPVTVGLGRVNNAAGNTKTVGAEIGMAAALSGNGRKSAIIKCAYGSSFLYPDTVNAVSKEQGTWTSPTYIKDNNVVTENTKIGALYERLLENVTVGFDMLIKDGYIPAVKGVFYMQGEAETSEKAHADEYVELISDFICDLRADLTEITGSDCASLPFVMGRITRNPEYDTRPYLTTVNAAQDTVAATLPKVSVVETGGLAQLDSWHYSADSQHYIGEQVINKIIAMDGKFGVGFETTNVTVSGAGAKSAGESVTVTFTPYEGCALDSVKMKVGDTVTDITANIVGGSYTFTMPENGVTFIASAKDPNEIVTEYGVIPSWFADAGKYPLIVFKDGKIASTASAWHEAVKVATVIARGPREGGNNVEILLRGSVSSENMCNDIGFIGGTLTVDLGGCALTAYEKQLFNLIGKSTDGVTHSTSLVVKNGTVLAKKPVVTFNNSSDEAYVTRKSFNVDFENVTFGLAAYTSQMIVSSYDDGTVGIDATVTLNGCDINFSSFDVDADTKSYALGGKTTLFTLNESTNKNNISVTVKGGNVIYGSAAKYVTVSSLGAKNEWGQDSFVFAEDGNGNYTSFTSDTDLSGLAVFKTDSGAAVEYVASGTGYTLAEVPAERLTAYGAIPASASSEHPFVLFGDGAFIATYDTWYNFLAAAGSVDWNKEITLLLREDYSTTTCKNSSSNLYLVGDLTIDLGGNTFTRGDYHMFQAIRKSDVARETNVTVKNGTLKVEKRYSSLIAYNSDGGVAKDASVKISFNFTLDGITLTADNEKVVVSGDTTYVGYSGKMICDAYGDGTVGTDNTITLNDCEIIVPNTSISGLFNTNDTDKDSEAQYNKHKISIRINGGYIDAAALNSKFTVAVLGEGDSITYGDGEDGEFYARLSSGAAHPTSSTVTDGKTLYLVASENDGTYDYYYYRSLETPYGTVSLANISALKYPFVLFDSSKKQVATYATWKECISAHPTGYVVMRRNYSTAECGGISDKLYLCKDLVIDLGGYTITQPESGGSLIFAVRRINNVAFVATVTVKNGTVSVNQKWNPAIVIRNTSSATDTAMAKPVFNFTFESVTFTSSAAYQGRLVLEAQSINSLGGTKCNFVFNDCTFEKNTTSNHPLFRLKEADGSAAEAAEKHDISVTVNGGKIVNNTSVAVVLASFSNVNSETGVSADSLTFGKHNGSYVRYVLPLGTAASSYTHIPTDSSVTLSLADISDESNSVYLLGEDGYLKGYGKLPFTYMDEEKYPFVAYKNGACTAGLTNWASNADTASNITSAVYYAARNSGATIVLRRDYTATTDSYNNVAHIVNATFDLGGFTFTTGDNAMIQAMAKTNGSAGVIDTVINIKNGTVLVTKYAVIVFNHANFDTYTTPEKWFITFDNVTFGFAEGSSANGLVTSTMEFTSTGTVGSLPTVTLNDCVFNAKAGTPIFNLKDKKDLVNASVTVNGGTVNIASLTTSDIISGTDKDSVTFGKDSKGAYTLFAISDKAIAPTAVINGGDLVFAKHAQADDALIYTLVSRAAMEFTPKTSVTLYTDFGYNIYLPTALISAIGLDGEEIALADLDTVAIEGEEHYKLTVLLGSYEALRDISLKVTLTADGENFVATYTFNLYKYASVIIGGEYPGVEKTLAMDMLAYVKAAYTYWNNSSDKLESIDALLGEDYLNTSSPDMSKEANEPSGSAFTNVTLHLGEAPAYRFYYEGDTAPDYTFTVGGRAVEARTGEDSFGKYVEIKVYAYEMLLGISFTDGDTAYEYNVYSYYAWADANGKSAEADITERLVKYCESAYAYGKTVNK